MSAASLAGLPLRQDLHLFELAPGRDGTPAWAIQDPVGNRFFRIGWLEYECLLRWPGDAAGIAADIAATTPLVADAGQVEAFARFLDFNQLLMASPGARRRMQAEAQQPGWRHWRWWLHHYLSIRIPLVRPERWLTRLLPFVAPLFTPAALVLLLVATLGGLVLVAQQWDSFTHGVLNILTPTGIAGFALALVVSKTLHELGHALVATRLGVRVGHMGIAFVVLWPMLYTDTGESWRLRSHRQRLAISVAGIAVELGLAGLATLGWALLDDGALRQAMLYLATTGWALSLALNASPFMRFDGYYIASDLLDVPNLHARSGALARTWLRRHLLGLPDPYPEAWPTRMRRFLIAFAFAAWTYRLVVFLGIAWTVYAFFFKALGIFLMCVEITWFVARPIWSELALWKRRWSEVGVPRRRRLQWLLGGLLIVLLLPWRFDVEGEGVAHAARQQLVYAPFPARLEALHAAGRVSAGTVLGSFSAPDLSAREQRSAASASALERQLAGLQEVKGGIDQLQPLARRLGEQLAEVRAARDERARLRIAAAFDGDWMDVDRVLRPGVWVDVRHPLGVLVDPRQWVVDAYVGQRQIERVRAGARAHFKPDGGIGRWDAEVVEVDTSRARHLAYDMLDTQRGGRIPTLRDGGQAAVPSKAVYRVRLLLKTPPPALREFRGSVWIEGTRYSLLWEAVKGTVAVLVRESGF